MTQHTALSELHVIMDHARAATPALCCSASRSVMACKVWRSLRAVNRCTECTKCKCPLCGGPQACC